MLHRFTCAIAVCGSLLCACPAWTAAEDVVKQSPSKDNTEDSVPGFFPTDLITAHPEWARVPSFLTGYNDNPWMNSAFRWPMSFGADVIAANYANSAPIGGFGAALPTFDPTASLYQWQQQVYAQQAYNNWMASRNTNVSSGRATSPLLPGQGSTTQGDICNPMAHIAMLYAPMFLPGGRRSGGNGYIPPQCFAAGTAIQLADDAGLRAIEQVCIGDRVRADSRRQPAIDPETHRRVELRTTKRDGTLADIVLLRPISWLRDHQVRVGAKVAVAMPECGFEGVAEVVAIGPCPVIRAGAGCVVTATIRHESGRVWNLDIEGLAEPIGTTANHRFWSADRQQWVRVDELRPGEKLQALDGSGKVLRLAPRAETVAVYNLEVQGSHAFHVSRLGLMARDVGNVTPSR